MESNSSPRKKLKSPVYVGAISKTSITCTNVPESLLDASAAKKHFLKFGKAQKIQLMPKRRMCIVEYDQALSAQRAVLNAGAYDGFMFEVTRTKPRVRRKSKREDDPDWLPDPDVEKELSAMGTTPVYRTSRQKPMDIEPDLDVRRNRFMTRTVQQVIPRKTNIREKQPTMSQPQSFIDSPTPSTMVQTSLGTVEAAVELHQIRSKVALTPDEQWRILDARDKILRSWGGAGSRVKVGGATIGTCPDMCPEKERLHRQAEYQVMTLETVPDSDGQLEPWRAVKQYSRSSADQEMPMCYELRPASVLMRTCSYLLHEIADTTRQVTLADWFHFMWDRLRGIRKDIAQQALCCTESIVLVEMCARFHAHCAARLADLEHTQFDQKLNTDNLTKCLQTLKHMYADATPEQKPREAEFRGYIALLNLGDANFWWEIKQLPLEIQKSEPILLSIQIFNALDNNNYVRFFRLVRDKATYLQACILLRYFNDVRARALVRIVKAYAPRGGSKYPAEELMNSLMFESVDHMQSFISHYGLHVGKTDEVELTVILDRNQLIEDSDPYPISRARTLIESKMRNTVGEVIAGGQLHNSNYHNHILYSSFKKDGTLKEAALIAEDQGYNTINDSNKNIQALKLELLKPSKTGRSSLSLETTRKTLTPKDTLNKIEISPRKPKFAPPRSEAVELFSFNPAIPVAPIEVIKDSPERIYGNPSHVFSFSKPQETGPFSVPTGNIFKSLIPPQSLDSQNKKIFGELSGSVRGTQGFATVPKLEHTFKKPDIQNKNIFSAVGNPGSSSNTFANKNLFAGSKDSIDGKSGSIFSKPSGPQDETKLSSNIFNAFSNNPALSGLTNFDTKSAPNGDITQNKLSPGSLFKSVINPSNGPDAKNYSIFQTKNTPSVAKSIFHSVNAQQNAKIYEFDENSDETKNQLELQLIEAKRKEELRKEEERKQELKREEERRLKEEKQKKLELKLLEEKRKKEEEERKQKELQRKLEGEKKAELKRKTEEERKFTERVDKESAELTEQLINEIDVEIVKKTLKDELERFNNLISCAQMETERILTELSNQICYSEMMAEKIWTEKLMKKWFYMWRKQFIRNKRRRNLLDDTPVWLTDNNPINTATHFRRLVEKSALSNMNAIHRGYKFTGESKQAPNPEPYNVIEIIRSSLLKRMKQICYPYDKCFFWKVTLVSPWCEKWLYRKLNIEKWLLDSFCDKQEHDSKSLLFVGKQSWNNLMNFAISISLLSDSNKNEFFEAVDGTNGMLFYGVENDFSFVNTIEKTISKKYPYQIIPVAVIMPKMQESIPQAVEQLLITFVNNKTISAFKIFIVDPVNVYDSLNAATKSALKWIAKNYPQYPPLEIDYLKTVCQTYLGNEIWHSLKSIQDKRIDIILKDFRKLIEFYNTALDKLTAIITNKDILNFPTFPLEFNNYLDKASPYPKPYEFITNKVKNSENIFRIRDIMKKLKLPEPTSSLSPVNAANMQDQIRSYCNQIDWIENNEVICKVIAIMPNELCNDDLTPQEFNKFFEQYDLVDVLNIVVYEKINSFRNLNNLFAIYDRSVLEKFRNFNWLFEMNLLNSIKHKALDYEDELDLFIEAKRRKLALDSMEQLMLEDKDQTLVEENLKMTEKNISKYNDCKKVVKELEETIEEERKKSLELENLLRAALGD